MNLSNFYKNKNILITGATGNVGTALVCKILNSFPKIGTLYLLVRSKKGKSAQERSDEYFNNEALVHLRKLNPNIRNKIVWLEGDLNKEKLGLSEESRGLVRKHVNIIFHSAASVKLAETMHSAIQTNIKGTKEVLDLGTTCENLDCFMHISTTYSNTRKTVRYVEEKYYQHPISPQELLHLAKHNTSEKLEEETPNLLNNDWVLTYTYSKNAAENLVKQYETKIKIGLFRPGIVVESFSEPFPYSGKYTSVISAIFMFASKGYIMKTDPNVQANCVPLDFTINAIIAATQDRIQKNSTRSTIYHYSSNNNPCSFTKIIKYYLEGVNDPDNFSKLTKYKLFQYIKDLEISLENRRSQNKCKEFEDLSNLITFYMWTPLYFECKNIEKVWNNLSEDDKKTFYFNINTVDWKAFFKNLYINTVLKSDENTNEQK